MAMVVADIGCDEFLKVYFNNDRPAGGNDLTLALYTNDYTPLQTSTTGNFTAAAGGGYSSKPLTAGGWTVDTGNDPSDAVYAQQTWTFTSALTSSASIYGYYVYDADGTLIFGERFASAFTPANNGDQLKVTPKFQMSTGTPA